eukprot:scaffold65380_cov44-Attheya_sp.AAC.3
MMMYCTASGMAEIHDPPSSVPQSACKTRLSKSPPVHHRSEQHSEEQSSILLYNMEAGARKK